MVGAAMVLRKPLRAVKTASSDDADDADGDADNMEITRTERVLGAIIRSSSVRLRPDHERRS
jgi:hypothetical protein